MTQPRSGNQELIIPSETIVEVEPRRLPFAYFRSWLAGILALLLIPLGVALLLTGQVREDQLQEDWIQAEAEVINTREDHLVVAWEANGVQQQSLISLNWAEDASASLDGTAIFTVDLCSIAVRTILPREDGATFPIWYNPANPKQSDCLPVTMETSILYTSAGTISLLLAGWFLLRIFHRAGMQAAAKS